ncbi:MAG: cytochrome C oxidase subunit IV family protein [Saprospiraceae bacterium]|nr:cytochrome C oxidase subunit IV family protein [Saprospiraceae bacterium]MCF8248784.1 cytochrome C oxidase subunit IV family protein [Saprospiraceae bacterium]MCF8279925.1 cytochrome C oxidase subunit IV family protein [Bacteroidales bacterium]MCF8310069.1 cytochrome C oxidase subunit IV family protein [Saprospiraceae bacterium]MCF8438969.1 cytochrome C oxidase subunit IV family protein [Saprospiraceae bacterium]
MASHASYAEQKKLVVYGLKLLGAITVIEVLIALLAKGHLIHGVHFTGALHYIYMALMVGFSLYKAYFIVYNFMHMATEVQGLRWSVLLPMLLLVWAVIAFFQEGASWGARRNLIDKKNHEEVNKKPATGSLDYDKLTVQDLI